jgi:hypothetical protein
MTDDRGEVFDPERSAGGRVVEYQFNISASLYDTSAGVNITSFAPGEQSWEASHTYGYVVDYISNESDTEFNNWTSSTLVTNYSAANAFVYGTDPGVNEVAFSADAPGQPDFRLYDHSNNIAIGHVTNVTPPSPDLAGNDRGSSPFDAGAYELNFDSGGADVTAAFGNVYVRLYWFIPTLAIEIIQAVMISTLLVESIARLRVSRTFNLSLVVSPR